MPAVVATEDAPRGSTRRSATPRVLPYPAERMERPVDRRENSAGVDDPGPTAAVEFPMQPAHPSLFDVA